MLWKPRLVDRTDLDDFVRSGRDEGIARGGDSERIELGRLRAVEDADGRAVVRVPVRDLPVGPSRQQLALIRVIPAQQTVASRNIGTGGRLAVV